VGLAYVLKRRSTLGILDLQVFLLPKEKKNGGGGIIGDVIHYGGYHHE